MRSRIVIERGGSPALGIVAICTGSFASLHKLTRVNIFVAIFANRRCSLELHLRGSHGRLVTITALHDTMRAKQGKFRFRMIESADVRPGPRVVARFAA